MDHGSGNKHVVLMAFGLPIMTSVIVVGSMYAGHLITTKSDRPTSVHVASAAPKIDVNVPTAPPPTVAVTATAAVPKVDVHVPAQLPPTVTVNTPPQAAPNITVNPAAPTVTIIDRREEKKESPVIPAVAPVPAAPAAPTPENKTLIEKPAAPPSAGAALMGGDAKPAFVAPTPSAPAAPAKAVEPASKPTPAAEPASMKSPAHDTARTAKLSEEDLTLDTLYQCASNYIETYCKKQGLDPNAESRKWNRLWNANLEQAMADNIDSGEQSFINRQVIAKRDYFNLETTTPEKVVEACRILLRYRDGQLAWLQAMKDAMTKENLKKTVTFLAAGPR